jgi:DNA-binding GntR family transcriptional regulator
MAVEFQFKPGERLNEVELSRRLGMSRAPLREALNRLVSEGLLTAVPNQGFSCRRLSASEISALYDVRADLETAAALLVPKVAPSTAIGALLVECLEILDTPLLAPTDALIDSDEAFHRQLAELSGNRERVRLLESINPRIRFVRRINLEGDGRIRQAFEEHTKIVERLVQGDGPGAASLLRQHLAVSAEQAAASIRNGLARIYADTVA